MNIARITLITLPLLVASSTALADADSEDTKKRGAAESRTPTADPQADADVAEEEEEEDTVVVVPVTPPPAPPPEVGTTQTTAADFGTRDVGEPRVTEPRGTPVGDRFAVEPIAGLATNDFNVGVGGRAGYTFKTPVYLGGTFMWYSGDTLTVTGPNGSAEAKRNFYYPAIEAGYDIGVAEGRFVIRPYAGGGALFDRQRVSLNGNAASDVRSTGVIYPGAIARVNLPNSPVYVGADTRLVIPFEFKGASYQGFLIAGLGL